MKRTFALSIIVLAGIVGVTAQGGGGVGTIQKLTANVYWIPGAGGNSTVYVGTDGVVLVDTKLANNGQMILDQIRSVTDKPITHIINTHTHGDHNGSNIFFPPSVEVVAHQNTQGLMRKMEVFQQAANAHGLPDRTFTDRLTLLDGNDAVDLYYFGAAHTSGDAFVVFRRDRVLAAGDAFANTAQPNIDLANGGSGVAYPQTIQKMGAALSRNVDVVIGGHAPAPLKPTDIADYAEFLQLMVDHARKMRAAGRTPEQAMMEFQATIPAKFRTYGLGAGRGGPGGAFHQLYDELGR